MNIVKVLRAAADFQIKALAALDITYGNPIPDVVAQVLKAELTEDLETLMAFVKELEL